MADRTEADTPAASAVKQTRSCTSHADRDLQPTCTCTNVCRAAASHSAVDQAAKSLGDSCVIGHQNLCYSQDARHYGIGDSSALGHTDWTPMMPVSSSGARGDAASVCECDKTGSMSEDVRLQQWRAAGIALKHALNHIARSGDCTCDGARGDVVSASEVRTTADAMNEMLEQSKGTPHDEGSNGGEHEASGQACSSCGKAKGDVKHDKGVAAVAASTADSGDAPVNLLQLRERIRQITQKVPTSTDQSDHALSARRQHHQSCKVARQRQMADTDDSDVNELCGANRRHDKEARKHVKVSRRRSSAGGKTVAVSPSCIAEGEEHAAALSESSTDPGIVVHAAEQTGTMTCPTSHSEVIASERMSKEAGDCVRKHSPHIHSMVLPTLRPRGLTEADSIANLADIESCTESFDVTEKSSDERETYTTSVAAVGWCDTPGDGSSHGASCDVIVDGSSHCKDYYVVSSVFEEPRHGTSQGR